MVNIKTLYGERLKILEKGDKQADRLIRNLEMYEVVRADDLARRIFRNKDGRATEQVEALIEDVCGKIDSPRSIEHGGRRFKIIYDGTMARIRPPQNILLKYFSEPKPLSSIKRSEEAENNGYQNRLSPSEPKSDADILRNVYEGWEIDRGLNILQKNGRIQEVYDLEEERNPCFATSHFVLPFSLNHVGIEPPLRWLEVDYTMRSEKIRSDNRIKRPSRQRIIHARFNNHFPTKDESRTLLTMMRIEDMHGKRENREASYDVTPLWAMKKDDVIGMQPLLEYKARSIIRSKETIPLWTLRGALLHYISEGNRLDAVTGGFVGWTEEDLRSSIPSVTAEMMQSRYIAGNPTNPRTTPLGKEVLNAYLEKWYKAIPEQFRDAFRDFVPLGAKK